MNNLSLISGGVGLVYGGYQYLQADSSEQKSTAQKTMLVSSLALGLGIASSVIEMDSTLSTAVNALVSAAVVAKVLDSSDPAKASPAAHIPDSGQIGGHVEESESSEEAVETGKSPSSEEISPPPKTFTSSDIASIEKELKEKQKMINLLGEFGVTPSSYAQGASDTEFLKIWGCVYLNASRKNQFTGKFECDESGAPVIDVSKMKEDPMWVYDKNRDQYWGLKKQKIDDHDESVVPLSFEQLYMNHHQEDTQNSALALDGLFQFAAHVGINKLKAYKGWNDSDARRELIWNLWHSQHSPYSGTDANYLNQITNEASIDKIRQRKNIEINEMDAPVMWGKTPEDYVFICIRYQDQGEMKVVTLVGNSYGDLECLGEESLKQTIRQRGNSFFEDGEFLDILYRNSFEKIGKYELRIC